MGDNRGFVKAVLIVLIALIVLGYLGYNINDIIKNQTVRDNLNWAWNLIKKVWENYLQTPVVWVFEKLLGFAKSNVLGPDTPTPDAPTI